MTSKVFRNATFLLMGRLSGLIANLVLLPFVLGHVSLAAYGLWAVFGSFVTYTGLADFGLGATFVRFVAEFWERRDRLAVRRLASFSLLFYLILAIALVPVAALLEGPLIALLHPAGSVRALANEMYWGVFAFSMTTMAMESLTSMLWGLQQMRDAALATFAGAVVYSGVLIWLVGRGEGVMGLLWANIARVAVSGVLSAVLATRTVGFPFANPFRLGRPVVKRLMSFGGWMQVNNFSNAVNFETDRFIIGGFVNLATVTYYEIGNRIAMVARLITLTVLTSLLPSLAGTDPNPDAVRRRYASANRTYVSLSLVLSGLLAGFAPGLVTVWVGHRYSLAGLTVVLVSVGYVAGSLTGVGTTVLRAQGRGRYEGYYGIASALVNIALTVALLKPLGFAGVLLGTALGTVIASALFLAMLKGALHLKISDTLGRDVWKVALACTVLSVGAYLLCLAVPEGIFASRIVGMTVLSVGGIAYLAALGVVLRLARVRVIPDWVIDRMRGTPAWTIVRFIVPGRASSDLDDVCDAVDRPDRRVAA